MGKSNIEQNILYKTQLYLQIISLLQHCLCVYMKKHVYVCIRLYKNKTILISWNLNIPKFQFVNKIKR